jgi:hypothetical protein
MSSLPAPDSGRAGAIAGRPGPADPDALRAEATRCRRLADSIGDRQALAILAEMAASYDRRARAAEGPER